MGNQGYFPHSKLFRPAREFFHYSKLLITLAVLIVFLSAAAIWNAYGLHRATKEVTSVYVSDVSLQLADDIDYRLGTILQNLQMLEDNLQSIEDYSDPQAVRQLFESKAKLLDFNSLVLVDLDGNIYSSHPIQNDFLNLPGVQASMRGDNSVSFLDGQSIAYSVPFYKDGTIVGVLAGVRDKQNMQNLIQPSSFSGQGLTCITDCDGQVIISPTNLDPFLQLDDIFMQNSDNSVVQNIQKMQSDMKNHLDGTFSFTAVDGTELHPGQPGVGAAHLNTGGSHLRANLGVCCPDLSHHRQHYSPVCGDSPAVGEDLPHPLPPAGVGGLSGSGNREKQQRRISAALPAAAAGRSAQHLYGCTCEY